MDRQSAKEQANTINTATAAALIKVTPRYVQQLASKGCFRPIARDRWNLVDVVQGYVAWLKDEGRQASKSAAESRVRDARATEIEQRIAREDRKLVTMEEATATLDEIAGSFITLVSRLPHRITRDPRERRRIEAIIDAERLRLSDTFAKTARKLKAGQALVDADDEDD